MLEIHLIMTIISYFLYIFFTTITINIKTNFTLKPVTV